MHLHVAKIVSTGSNIKEMNEYEDLWEYCEKSKVKFRT